MLDYLSLGCNGIQFPFKQLLPNNYTILCRLADGKLCVLQTDTSRSK